MTNSSFFRWNFAGTFSQLAASRTLILAAAFMTCSSLAFSQSEFTAGGDENTAGQGKSAPHIAPPTAPAIQVRKSPAAASALTAAPDALQAYSVGNPTNEEQLYLEYLNRARANPTAEGQRLKNTTDADVLSAYSYFGVNLTLMASQFSQIPVAPPLAFSSKLIASARGQSNDMLVHNFQGHNGSNGSTLPDRVNAQGYNWSTLGENVYAYSTSVFYGHAGFEVDWGGNSSTGGMQSPPGHRQNIHDASFREVGVGVVDGSNGSVGPQIVTQDFGTQMNATPFITGVAYHDTNNNSFYDIGEGAGGITVTVTGANYYAVTSTSGAYAVPVPGNGTYTVTFSATGVTTAQKTAVVSNLNNVKVDYLVIAAPVQTFIVTPLASPNGTISPNTAQTVTMGSSVPFTATPATGYIVNQWLVNGNAVQTGGYYYTLANVTADTTVQATFKAGTNKVIGADLNGDGKSDIIWQSNNTVAAWLMNGTTLQSVSVLCQNSGGYQIKAVADLDGDGNADLIWQNGNTVAAWLMSGTTMKSAVTLCANSGGYQIKAVADIDGDGKADLIWQNGNTVAAWLMDGTERLSIVTLCANSGGYQVKAVADMNGDGKADIIWQNGNTVAIWLMNGTTLSSIVTVQASAAGYQVQGIADLNGDGKTDLILQKGNSVVAWIMNGTTVQSVVTITTNSGGYQVVGAK